MCENLFDINIAQHTVIINKLKWRITIGVEPMPERLYLSVLTSKLSEHMELIVRIKLTTYRLQGDCSIC